MLASLTTVLFIAAANIPTPQWQPDYAKAFSAAGEKHKPIAVFLGEGAKPGDMPEAAAKKLNDSYVCVYIDTTSADGKKMAKSFEMTKGLVISNSKGDLQALRLVGEIAPTDLTKCLERFADPNMVITTTATSANPVVYTPTVMPANYCPTCPNGRCPNIIR